ncbi:hypothetical protein [Trinickia sp.]|uniref:hypothetical protein n=1 Tax=Trinickia sp. TaxID=2571163 RepID=UPI003F8172A4
MTDDYSDLIAQLYKNAPLVGCEFSSPIGDEIEKAADALTHLSQRVQRQALEYVSLSAQCDENVARIAELEAKNAAWVQQKIDADARIAALESQLAALEADRDSWRDQCSQRVDDWDEMRKKYLCCSATCDELHGEVETLKADNASMLDGLTKESTARCEAEDKVAVLESQIAARESLLRESYELTCYAAAPFTAPKERHRDCDKNVYYIYPTTEDWWDGLRDDIEALQPKLAAAVSAEKERQS